MTMHKMFAALLAALLVACVCLAAQKATNDNAINDNVRIKLSADREVKGGALIVDVKDGVVTISGSVETQRQKGKATKIAKGVKGVKRVVNNITVKERASTR